MKDKKTIIIVLACLFLGALFFFFNRQTVNQNQPQTSNPSPTTSLTNPDQAETALKQLLSSQWTWKETVMSDDTIVKPQPNKPSFTITFTEDDKVSFTTDCNNGTGSYSVGEDNKITLGPLAMTKKFCQDSKEEEFTKQLGQVDAFMFQDTNLYLLLKTDSGSMEFTAEAN